MRLHYRALESSPRDLLDLFPPALASEILVPTKHALYPMDCQIPGDELRGTTVAPVARKEQGEEEGVLQAEG